MSESKYRIGATIYEANRFQPDCCSSLVYAWFGAMKIGEAAGEQWCAKAHREEEHSQFYAHHIARNDLIQGQTRSARVKEAQAFSAKVLQVASLMKRIDLLYVAQDVALAIQEPLQELRNRKPEADARRIMGFRVVHQWTDNLETQLGLCLKELGNGARFYMLSVAADERGHVVGIVSTKSEGWFSPNGYLYYFDPNISKVSRWQSRDDLIEYLKTLNQDYKGFRSLTELAVL